ncbi:fatty acyl-CoA reductase wat-like [Ostrinia nubilalis]|uniref:fatty acyl-CoA reductase wat-like n=1 Tax=Ostrinia nubilalis TaxID=29057 RepID=UPI0030823CD2
MAPLLDSTPGDDAAFKIPAMAYSNDNDNDASLKTANNNDIDTRNNVELTQIQKFYNGKNILITGATGFLGKILVQKLLRCCPGVENLYLLVRQKRGKDIYTRIEEIFDDPVFDRLKEEVPKFRHKIVVIPADCEAAGLGLTLSDRQTLTEKVNVIFHSAATVKFDEQLRLAFNVNVKASLHVLRLARDIKGLDVLMHISTAYSNSHLDQVEEKFYPCKMDLETLNQTIEKMTDEEINSQLSKLLGEYPNTYTMTKALAENELRINSKGIPLAIFRPAVVVSSAREPVKCWLDNMNGPNGIVVGSGTGILRTLQCDMQGTADLVPVDMVVNCLMAAAVNVNAAYAQSNPPPEPPIFNYVSSVENKITWGEFMTLNMEQVDKYPFSNAVWYISLRLTKSWLLNRFYMFFLHLIPAVLMDGLTVCVGKKPKMLKVYKKIHKFSDVLSYFCTKDIEFCNRRTQELWQKTSEEDKQLFPFSMAELDWRDYFQDYYLGIRRYLFKENDDNLPQARIKWKRLYYLHQLVTMLFYFLALYALWSIFSSFLL